MKLFETLTQTFNTSFGTLSGLKTQLASLKEQIECLETKAAIYSERDWLVVEECDKQIRALNVRYLDIDEKIQKLEKDTVVQPQDFVCQLDTTV